MGLTRVRGAGVGTLSGDTTTVTLEDTSSHSANTGPAISFKSKDSGGTTREVAKVIGESHSGTNEGNLALQTRNGGTLETKWKVFKNGSLLPSSTDYGIYLGATAAGDANLLNDYEEGDWTPTNNGTSNVTIDVRGASYTKIGRCVVLRFYIGITATSSGNCIIGGLPFTSSAETSEYSVGTLNHNTSAGEGLCRIGFNVNTISVLNTNNNYKTWNQFNNSFIISTISYFTDS